MNKYYVIAIDGPAGSGKSTTAQLLASRLGFTYLDTGAMYRTVTLAAVRKNIDLKNEIAVGEIAGKIKFDIASNAGENKFLLDGEDVSAEIRTPRINSNVSQVSSYKRVRQVMVKWQQKFAHNRNIVAEGRDMGTVVFPNADLKIFLIADLQTRAIRRCRQLESAGLTTSIDEQASALSSRDMFDSGRENSPLKKAEDAVVLNTTDMSINQQVEMAYELACEQLNIAPAK